MRFLVAFLAKRDQIPSMHSHLLDWLNVPFSETFSQLPLY